MIVKHGVAPAAAVALLGLSMVSAMAADTLVLRGKYLVTGVMACGNCHTPQGPKGPLPGMDLAGGLKFGDGGMNAFSRNITPDKETGIGNWSDDEIVKAIREGKRPDGSTIGPPMPVEVYRNLSDDDAKAVVAYLRTVKPVHNMVEKSTYPFPLPPAYGPPITSVPAVDKTDKLKYGAYLASSLGHCIVCHSTPDEHGVPDMAKKAFAGGMSFKGPWGESVSANLTPTNLAHWTDADIKRAITTGVDKDKKPLKPPMGFAYYKNLSKGDLDALVGYLRSLPPT